MMKKNTRIPDKWLQGRSLIHERAGLDPRAAIEASVRDWQEQEQLEVRFHEQRKPRAKRSPKQ